MAFEWLPGVGASVLTGALLWWKNQSVDVCDVQRRVKDIEKLNLWDFKSRMDVVEARLKDHESSSSRKDQEMAAEIQSALTELKAVAQIIRGWSERQQIINEVTTRTLDSLCTKVDKNSEDIASQNSTLGFLVKNFKAN